MDIYLCQDVNLYLYIYIYDPGMWPLSLHCLIIIDVEWSGLTASWNMDGSDQMIILSHIWFQ